MGVFQNPGVCRQEFPSFLSSTPFLPLFCSLPIFRVTQMTPLCGDCTHFVRECLLPRLLNYGRQICLGGILLQLTSFKYDKPLGSILWFPWMFWNGTLRHWLAIRNARNDIRASLTSEPDRQGILYILAKRSLYLLQSTVKRTKDNLTHFLDENLVQEEVNQQPDEEDKRISRRRA